MTRGQRGKVAARVAIAYLLGLVSFAVLAAGGVPTMAVGVFLLALLMSSPVAILAVALAAIFAERIVNRPALWTLCAFAIVCLASSFTVGDYGILCAAVSAVFFYCWFRAFPISE